MQGVGIVAVLDQVVGNLLAQRPGAAKDDAVDAWPAVDDAFQRQVFVVGAHHVVDVAHIVAALVARADDKLLRLVHVVARYLGNLARHGGREQQHFSLLGHMGENGVDVVHKPHVEHFVGFVEDDGAHLLQFHFTAVNQVEQAARCGHHDLHALVEGADLALDARTAVHGQDVHAVGVLGVVGQVAGRLQAQLAGGVQDECLRGGRRCVDALQRGQAEGCRLACSCLGQRHHIGGLVEQVRNHLFLYRHGSDKAQVGHGPQQVVADA